MQSVGEGAISPTFNLCSSVHVVSPFASEQIGPYFVSVSDYYYDIQSSHDGVKTDAMCLIPSKCSDVRFAVSSTRYFFASYPLAKLGILPAHT